MTLTATPNRYLADGNGVTNGFTLPFQIQSTTDVSAVLVDIATGVSTPLVYGSGFTLAGIGGATTTMVLTTAPAVGKRLIAWRDPVLDQLTSYTPGDPFPAKVHEGALDHLSMQIARLDDRVDRMPYLPDSSLGATSGVPEPIEGALLGWTGGRWQWILAAAADLGSALLSNVVSAGDALIRVLQPLTGAVARTQHDKNSEWVSVTDFGAVGDGVTDNRSAFQAAFNASKNIYIPSPAVSYYLSDYVSPTADTVIYGDGPKSVLAMPDGSKTCIYVSGTTGVTVRDIKITTKVQTNATAYIGAVLIANASDNCTVQNVTVSNWGYWGVCIRGSSHCLVTGCRFSSWFGTVQDSACITVFDTASNNTIDGNFCIANSYHGIFMQDPYNNSFPTGNRIINNVVANSRSDGISVYVTHPYDTQTLISGNRIYNIAGTELSGMSGHGIYVQSVAGTVISNNHISNCCISTTSFETQVVGAIGIATGDSTSYPGQYIYPVTVVGNNITAQRGPCIAVQTCGSPVILANNVLTSTGTTAVRGEAVYSVNANGLKVLGNTIKHANTNYSAVNISASTLALTGISISNNNIICVQGGISLSAVSGGSMTDTGIHGNQISGLTSGSSIGVSLIGLTNVSMTGNQISGTYLAYYHSNSTRVRLSCNRLRSTSGSVNVLISGAAAANVGSVIDESNDISGPVSNDPANGTIIALYSNAAPAAGNWSVGDRVIQSVPAAGQPKGWRCTVSGTPGTWVSEGNL